jgi:MazG family protein
MPSDSDKKSIDDLIAIMAALRTPVTGCPWDLEQSFETIAPYTIEEAYEVADAIERGDRAELRDELGDLLLQVVYHARLAQEEGAFDFADVTDAICAKMVRRHPHVFGDETVRSSVELKGLWERIKAEEKAEKEGAREEKPGSILDGVPLALPALTRSAQLQAKASRAGFDWPEAAPVLEKVREELDELERETAAEKPDRRKAEEELGDLLFAAVNLARHLKVDPEAALRAAIGKFARRFKRMEEWLEAEGRAAEECDLEELDRLWERAKAEES